MWSLASAHAGSDMTMPSAKFRQVCALAAVCVCVPAFASGIDCGRALGPIEKAICSTPALRAADTRLARVYAAALRRDPAQAVALRQDQREWLGERNRAGVTDLPRLYQERTDFLTDVANPMATRWLPIAQKLLASLTRVSSVGRFQTVMHMLAKTGGVTLPQRREFDSGRYLDSVSPVIAALPAPPDAGLQAALEQFSDASLVHTLFYLPAVGLGGVLTVEGSAACESWVGFKKLSRHTVKVSLPVGGCERDGGTSGYLVLVGGRAIAVNETDGIYTPQATLTWRLWSGHGFGPAEQIRIRFGWTFTPAGKTADCHKRGPRSLECAVDTVARQAFASYLRNPVLITTPAWLTSAEHQDFLSLKSTVQQELAAQDPCCGVTGLWFPVRFGTRIMVGNIAEAHIGSHPEPGFVVSFWEKQGRRVIPLPPNYISPRKRTILLAARVPVQQSTMLPTGYDP